MASLTPGGKGGEGVAWWRAHHPGAQVPQTKRLCPGGLQQDALAGEGQLGAKWGTGLGSTCQGQCRRGEGGCGTLRCLPARISFRTWGSSGLQRMAIGYHSCP